MKGWPTGFESSDFTSKQTKRSATMTARSVGIPAGSIHSPGLVTIGDSLEGENFRERYRMRAAVSRTHGWDNSLGRHSRRAVSPETTRPGACMPPGLARSVGLNKGGRITWRAGIKGIDPEWGKRTLEWSANPHIPART